MSGHDELDEDIEVFEPSENPEDFDPDLRIQDIGEDYEDHDA